MSYDFKLYLDESIELINKIIYGFLPQAEGYYKKIADAVNYSVKAGGKRLRPLFLLECFRLCNNKGYSEGQIHPFIAAIEMIHTYSLVHDDLPAMDNDELRRGLPTTHIKFGEDFGILAGDALLNLAYELMLSAALENNEKRFVAASGTIANKAGIKGMVGGQCLDVELTGLPIDEAQLDFIFKLKTAALIEACFGAGAQLADASADTVEKLMKAGRAVGMAFQIRDDILDTIGDEANIGKPVGSDEKNQKTTYVTLHGMDRAKRDVSDYSDEALTIINEVGDNQFLNDLIVSLVARNK